MEVEMEIIFLLPFTLGFLIVIAVDTIQKRRRFLKENK
jgi:hypothetical protein